MHEKNEQLRGVKTVPATDLVLQSLEPKWQAATLQQGEKCDFATHGKCVFASPSLGSGPLDNSHEEPAVTSTSRKLAIEHFCRKQRLGLTLPVLSGPWDTRLHVLRGQASLLRLLHFIHERSAVMNLQN